MITKIVHILFFITVFIAHSQTDSTKLFVDSTDSPTGTASATTSIQKKDIPVLLFCGGGETSVESQVKNGWFSAIMDAHFQLRAVPVKNVKTISTDSLYRFLRSSWKYTPGHYGLSMQWDAAVEAGRKLKADYIINSFYEVNEQDNIVVLSVEIYSMKTKKTIGVFEKNFGYAQIGYTLDSAFFTICGSVGVSWDEKERQSLFRDISASSIKAAEKTGNSYIRYTESTDTKTQKSALGGLHKNVSVYPGFALATYLYAYACERQGDLENAARMYNTLTRRNGLYYPSLYAKVLRYFRLSNIVDLALRTMSVADQKGVESPAYNVEKARLLQKTGDEEKAARMYEKALALNPNYGEALIYMARYYNKTMQYEEAQSCAHRLIDNSILTGEAYLELGMSLMNQKKHTDALTALEEANKRLVNNPELAYTLGSLYYQTEDYENASVYLSKALTTKKNDEALLLSCSDAFVKSNRNKAALDILLKYRSAFYSSKGIEKEIGLLYHALNDTSNALLYLENCVTIQPPDYRVFLSLGDIYSMYGRNRDAIAMYTKAEPYVDDKNLITFSMAKLSFTLKDYSAAEKKLKSIIAQKPGLKGANRFLGEIAELNGEKKSALAWYKKERKHNGAEIALQRKIAELSFALSLFSASKKESLKLLEMDSSQTTAYTQLALIHLQEKNFSEAERYSKKAEQAVGFDKIFYKKLGKGLARAGKSGKAIEAYNTYFSSVIDDDSAWVELGMLYKKQDNDTLRAQAYCTAYGLNRAHAPLYAEAGHIYYSRKDMERAQQFYGTFLKNGNHDDLVSYNLACIMFEKEKYHRTIALLTLLPRSYQMRQDVRKMLAASLFTIGQYTKALPYITKYLLKKPNEIEFVEMAAIAYEKSSDLQSAAMYFKKYLSLAKDTANAEYAFHLAELYEKLNRSTDIITQLRSNIARFPHDFRNSVKLAEVYRKQKKYTAVISLCGKIAAKSDAPAIMFKYIADAYYGLNDKSSALVWYEKYLFVKPDDAWCRKRAAEIYYLNKNYHKAIDNYTRYLDANTGTKNDYYNLGNSYFEKADFQKASAYFEQVAAAGDTTGKKALSCLTVCYENLSDTMALINNLVKRTAVEKSNYALNSKLADLLTTVNRNDEAVLIYENMTRIKPSDVKIHEKLAVIYLDNKLFVKAKSHLETALRYAPGKAGLRYIKAQCHIALRENEKAEKELKRVITQQPSMHEARYDYAELLNRKNAHAAALSQLKSAVRSDPQNVRYLLAAVNTALKMNQGKPAKMYVERALGIEPDAGAVIKTAGLVYAVCGERGKAVDYLTKAVSVKPVCEECALALGKIYFAEHNHEKAERLLIQVTTIREQKYEALVMLGDMAYARSKVRKAEGYYQKALQLRPDDSELLYKLIAANLALNRVRKASRLVAQSRRLKRDGWVELARARVFEQKDDLRKAWNAFASARKYLPKNFDVIYGQGRVRYKQQKYSSAISYLRAARGYNDTVAGIHFMIGDAYFHTRNYTKATASLNRSIDLQPEQSDSYFTLAVIYDKRKNNTAAIHNYTLAITHDSRNWEAYYRLAKIQKTRRDYDLAAGNYLKAYQYNKSKKLGLEIFKIVGDFYYTQLSNSRKAKKYYRKYLRLGGKDKVTAGRFAKLDSM